MEGRSKLSAEDGEKKELANDRKRKLEEEEEKRELGKKIGSGLEKVGELNESVKELIQSMLTPPAQRGRWRHRRSIRCS